MGYPKPPDRKIKRLVKGKGKGPSITGAKAIATQERHLEWLQLRKEGWSSYKIAKKYGVSQPAVVQAVDNLLYNFRREAGKEYGEFHMQALDDLIEKALTDVEDAGQRLELIRKVRADQRKMLGLDAPHKLEMKLETETLDVEQLRPLLRAVGYDIVPLAITTTGEGAPEHPELPAP